ncbi:MAG: TolC family protein [Acidobacteriota bacterium]
MIAQAFFLLSLAVPASSHASAQTQPAAAQPGPAELRLTLAEALAMARDASPRLAQLQALYSASDAGVHRAGANRLPQVDLSAGYTRYSHVPEFSVPIPGRGTQTIFPDLPDNYRARLGVWMPLYTGGRLASLSDAAKMDREASERDVVTGTIDLVYETNVAYWSLVTARESERVLNEALAAYESHLEDAQNRQRFGLAASNEVLAVQVERDQAELARLDAGNAAEIANATLVRLLGVATGTRVDAAEPLDQPQAGPIGLEDAIAEALATRPERAALKSRIVAAEAMVRVERSARLPQVSAVAGYDYANPNRRIMPMADEWKATWDVSFNVALSVFDSGRTSASMDRASAQLEALKQQLEELDRRIELNVTSALLDLESAHAALAVADRNLDAARENRRVSADRYREGVSPSSELLDAEVALQQVGLQRTRALARIRQSTAGLERAIGR